MNFRELVKNIVVSYFISPMHAVTQRIDAHVEKLNCHPLEIRRYYRQFDY